MNILDRELLRLGGVFISDTPLGEVLSLRYGRDEVKELFTGRSLNIDAIKSIKKFNALRIEVLGSTLGEHINIYKIAGYWDLGIKNILKFMSCIPIGKQIWIGVPEGPEVGLPLIIKTKDLSHRDLKYAFGSSSDFYRFVKLKR